MLGDWMSEWMENNVSYGVTYRMHSQCVCICASSTHAANRVLAELVPRLSAGLRCLFWRLLRMSMVCLMLMMMSLPC